MNTKVFCILYNKSIAISKKNPKRNPEPPPLSDSLASPEPLLSESLAYSMPVARSIFIPTTPFHPAHIGRAQSLIPQSFRTFVPSTVSSVTLQVASNDAHIIPPPPQFSEALFSPLMFPLIAMTALSNVIYQFHACSLNKLLHYLHNYVQFTENNERTFFQRNLFSTK